MVTPSHYPGTVTWLSALTTRHPLVTASVLAAALLLRLLVPAGFMPAVDHGHISLTLCSGYAPAQPAVHHASGHDMGHHDETRTQSPCAFADLALSVLGSVDPLLLAAALLFVMVLALRRATPVAPLATPRLRPPLRAPPVPA